MDKCNTCNLHPVNCEGCETEMIINTISKPFELTDETNGKFHINIDELREKFFKQETDIHNGEMVVVYKVFEFIRNELER